MSELFKRLYEILVPAQTKSEDGELTLILTECHEGWDEKVRKIAGGLTVMRSAKGHWISPDNKLFVENMIPVRIYCNAEEIHSIADMTAQYYRQQAVMFYVISEAVVIKHYETHK